MRVTTTSVGRPRSAGARAPRSQRHRDRTRHRDGTRQGDGSRQYPLTGTAALRRAIGAPPHPDRDFPAEDPTRSPPCPPVTPSAPSMHRRRGVGMGRRTPPGRAQGRRRVRAWSSRGADAASGTGTPHPSGGTERRHGEVPAPGAPRRRHRLQRGPSGRARPESLDWWRATNLIRACGHASPGVTGWTSWTAASRGVACADCASYLGISPSPLGTSGDRRPQGR